MSEGMTAEVTLTLLDEISAPIKKITEQFALLKKSLGLAGDGNEMEHLKEGIHEVNVPARELQRTIEGIGREAGISHLGDEAERTVPKIERLSLAFSKVKSVVSSSMQSIHGSMAHFHESVENGIGKGFGAAAAGFGLVEPVREAAEFDNTTRHIGIGLDIHGEALDKFRADFGADIEKLARSTGQMSEKLMEGAGFFGREGFSLKDIREIMPQVAKISTAYNSDPEAVAKATFAFHENMGIKNSDLSNALASMAVAGKLADLPFEKLAPIFPELASAAGGMGIKGLSGTKDLLADLAVVRKSSGSEGQAVTNLKQLMEDVGQKTFGEAMKKHGIDSYKVMSDAKKKGENPLIAIVNVLDKLTHHGEDQKVMADFIHNQQAKLALNALFGHGDQVKEIRGKLEKTDQTVLDKDAADGIKTLKIQMQQFSESVSVLTRRVGTDFAPVLAKVTIGIQGIAKGFEFLDRICPRLSPILLGIVGTILAITAGVAALAVIIPPLIAGFGVLATILGVISLPVTLTIAAIAALGVAIYEGYKHWDVLKSGIIKFFSWLKEVALHPLKSLYNGLVDAGSGTGHSIKDDETLGDKVSKWYAGLRGEQEIIKPPKLVGESHVPAWMIQQIHNHQSPAPHAQNHPPAKVVVELRPEKGTKVKAHSTHDHVKIVHNPGRAVGAV